MAEKQNIEEVEDFSIEVTESFEFVHIDEGEYDVDLTKLVKLPNVKVVRDKEEQTVDMLRWTFTTPDGIEVTGTSSAKFTPKSKAYGWAEKILVRAIEVGETFGPKDLVGKPCRVIVKDKTIEGREFQGKKQEPVVVSVVSDVLSPKKSSAKGK